MAPIPVTIVTGFLGSGKTTLILNLIPQLPKNYKLALLKNEYGDLAVDSALASEVSISGVRELLNGCICCNLVGQLGEALFELRDEVCPDRIIIETSGSAFPATLAMEVNRIGRDAPGSFTLDGVLSVVDVENWKGYEDKSVTAKMQAKYTDLIVFNKWELVDEMVFERCVDKVGDLGVDTAWVKSRKGLVDLGVVIGIDGALISTKSEEFKQDVADAGEDEHEHKHEHARINGEHEHYENHQSEVEVLSVVLKPAAAEGEPAPVSSSINIEEFEGLLLSAPKDEVYRIKGLIASATPPPDSSGETRGSLGPGIGIYVLNWAFSRWTYTELPEDQMPMLRGASARLTLILSRDNATRWKKKIESSSLISLASGQKGDLSVEKVG